MGLIINGSLEVMVISKSDRRKGVQYTPLPNKCGRASELKEELGIEFSK
jgi:hypothetical protein